MTTPDQISSLAGWWKADSLALANGAQVSSWTDSSGNSRTVSATGTGTTYETNQINGLPAVHPSGTATNYLSASFTVAQPLTLFVVARRDADNASTQTPVASSGANDPAFFFTTNEEVGIWGGTSIVQSASGQTVDSAHIYSAILNGGSSAVYLDGTSVATGNPGSSGLTGITFGSNSTHNAEWFAGEIAEVILYSRQLTATERAQVHSYLSDRYAITVSDYFDPTLPALVSDRGTAANATAATTTSLSLTSPTSIAVGNYLIARVAVDNSGTSGAAPGCTVTDPRSNTWTVLGPALADPGAAAAGATAYLCYAKVNTAYQAADALTFNWGGVSTTAKAIVAEEWRNIHSTTPIAVSSVTNDSVAAASTTAVALARTPTAARQIVYACLATEGIAADAVGADADTTNGTWTALTTTASANATATNNQRVSGAYKVVTAAGAQSWDSTITSRDWAGIAVVFAPAPTAGGTAAGSYAYAGAATGKRTPIAAGAGTYAYAGAATGKRTPKGSGAGSYTYAGNAVGGALTGGTGAGSYAYAGAAIGKRTPKATAPGTYTYTGLASGKRTPISTSAGMYAYAGAATGKRVAKATTAGTYTYTGAAAGKRVPKGAGAPSGGFGSAPFGSLPFGWGPNTYHYAGAALTAPVPGQGAGSGSYAYAGAGAGKRTPKASHAGTYAYVGVAVGTRPSAGVGAATTGAYAYVGASVGKRTPKATAPGAWSYAGASTGKRAPKAVALGAWQFAGAAVGSTARRGSGAGSWAYDGFALGSEFPFVAFGEEFFAFI